MTARELTAVRIAITLLFSPSLLPCSYAIGIVDVLSEWSSKRRLQRWAKTVLLRQDPDGVSEMAPMAYCLRFQRKLRELLLLPGDDGRGLPRPLPGNGRRAQAAAAAAATMAAPASTGEPVFAIAAAPQETLAWDAERSLSREGRRAMSEVWRRSGHSGGGGSHSEVGGADVRDLARPVSLSSGVASNPVRTARRHAPSHHHHQQQQQCFDEFEGSRAGAGAATTPVALGGPGFNNVAPSEALEEDECGGSPFEGTEPRSGALRGMPFVEEPCTRVMPGGVRPLLDRTMSREDSVALASLVMLASSAPTSSPMHHQGAGGGDRSSGDDGGGGRPSRRSSRIQSTPQKPVSDVFE